MAAWCNAWNVFARPNTGVVGSNPTLGMDICLNLLFVCVVMCRLRPCDGFFSVGVLPTVFKITKLKLNVVLRIQYAPEEETGIK
jgi:hypothetical protein